MKTCKSMLKRFRITATGKVRYKKSGRRRLSLLYTRRRRLKSYNKPKFVKSARYRSTLKKLAGKYMK